MFVPPGSFATLMRKTLPKPSYLLDPLIPDEGIAAVVSRSKLGKSWFLLQLSLAAPMGGTFSGRSVKHGAALYLALEDTERRLQDRICRQLSGDEPTLVDAWEYATAWPRLHEGGLEKITAWVEAHPTAVLVAIDTLAKVRPPRSRHESVYAEDYAAIVGLKTLADTRHLAIVISHHDRKAQADDQLDTVSGSIGRTGALDTILLLTRVRGEDDAILFATGRDIPEQSLALRLHPTSKLWTILGDAEETILRSDARRAVIELLMRESPLPAAEIAKRLGRGLESTKVLLSRMARDGDLRSTDRGYVPRR
jgi:hypothetical protein